MGIEEEFFPHLFDVARVTASRRISYRSRDLSQFCHYIFTRKYRDDPVYLNFVERIYMYVFR